MKPSRIWLHPGFSIIPLERSDLGVANRGAVAVELESGAIRTVRGGVGGSACASIGASALSSASVPTARATDVRRRRERGVCNFCMSETVDPVLFLPLG